MYFSVRRTRNETLIKSIYNDCFEADQYYTYNKNNKFWIAADREGEPVGFGVATDFGCGVLFLSWAGVLSRYRGNGIHKRLIKVRLRYARSRGFSSVITYTSRDNYASANNLMDIGFRSYDPEYQYAGDDFNYWILEIPA